MITGCVSSTGRKGGKGSPFAALGFLLAEGATRKRLCDEGMRCAAGAPATRVAWRARARRLCFGVRQGAKRNRRAADGVVVVLLPLGLCLSRLSLFAGWPCLLCSAQHMTCGNVRRLPGTAAIWWWAGSGGEP